ncbi:hypothetical protein M3Y94_00850300 [Aphelenchoides besseyi]|nr:hypothetical protein M3Y94_00850300 [Aphelenchoides besseyi]
MSEQSGPTVGFCLLRSQIGDFDAPFSIFSIFTALLLTIDLLVAGLMVLRRTSIQQESEEEERKGRTEKKEDDQKKDDNDQQNKPDDHLIKSLAHSVTAKGSSEEVVKGEEAKGEEPKGEELKGEGPKDDVKK